MTHHTKLYQHWKQYDDCLHPPIWLWAVKSIQWNKRVKIQCLFLSFFFCKPKTVTSRIKKKIPEAIICVWNRNVSYPHGCVLPVHSDISSIFPSLRKSINISCFCQAFVKIQWVIATSCLRCHCIFFFSFSAWFVSIAPVISLRSFPSVGCFHFMDIKTNRKSF